MKKLTTSPRPTDYRLYKAHRKRSRKVRKANDEAEDTTANNKLHQHIAKRKTEVNKTQQ